jgi:hypothetical protein
LVFVFLSASYTYHKRQPLTTLIGIKSSNATSLKPY